MKIIRSAFILVALTFSCLVLIGISNAEASDYVGEFCWKASDAQDIGPIFKFSVSYIGGDNFSLHGRGTYILNDEEGSVFGNANIAGNQVLLSFTGSAHDQTTNETMTATCTGVLDITTLNGTFSAVFIRIVDTTSTITNLDGTFTLVTCP